MPLSDGIILAEAAALAVVIALVIRYTRRHPKIPPGV